MNNPTIIGKATLYNMDCMELLKATPDKFYDLALVDPPYGINFAKKHTGKGWVVRETKQWDKSAPNEDYFKELFRCSKNQIIWGANYMTPYLPPSQHWIFWDKGQRNFSLADGELAFSSFDKALRVFDMSRAAMMSEKAGEAAFHPTQKPIKLYEWLLSNYAKPNDKILDTHLGSGSHAIACNNLGFELTACELDKDYFDASVKRIKQAMAQDTLFEPSLPSNQVYEQVDMLYGDKE